MGMDINVIVVDKHTQARTQTWRDTGSHELALSGRG